MQMINAREGSMIMFLFSTPENYKEMLQKIALFTCISAFIHLFLLSKEIQKVKEFINWNDKLTLDLSIISLPIIFVGIGLGIGVLSLMLHLHDRISDVLQIRKNFDVKYVLKPMLIQSNASRGRNYIGIIKENRKILMGDVFYKYATSTNPSIDRHLITKALANWTWFWIVIESSLLTIISLGISLFFGSNKLIIYFMISFLIHIMFALLLFYFSTQNIKPQIKEILSDPIRKQDIKEKFENALRS